MKEEQDVNMVRPVRASNPKRGLANLGASSAAGRERPKSGWWPEHWDTVVSDHRGGTGRTPQERKEKGVTGREGELEPPKPTKAQREARGWAQGGQVTRDGQCSQQEVVTPLGMGGETAQRGPSVAEQTLYRRWMPYDQMGIEPAIGIDFFKGYHVSDFLDKFEQIASHYKWSEERMLEEVMGFIHIGLKHEVDRVVKGARSSWGKFCDDMRHKYWLVGGTPCSGGNNIMRVRVRDACRRRLYALHNAMAGVGDQCGPVSDVIDRLLHWSLPAIRAEFGDEVADVISSSLPFRVCGRDFTLRYMPGDSGVDYGQGGSQGSASGGLGESHDGSQNSFPSSRRASQRSDRGRGRPRSAGRCTPTPARPQTWWDSWDDVDQCGPRPEIDRASVEEAMARWSGPTAPDVVFLELVKLLQLLGMFHLYCPWRKGSCRVSVESVSYTA
ncbi:hypothetical protein CBR_g50552 [Chara braunii]|uniref:Uncharacterized protein n=1 Tax=Chara braunii TaxID=69332 RepID=A0A388M743_CHABU|nr:hypothetical protein CBR_g50552 [Chara braunii]|eukprot:GBG90303.1 hypothetical protein CBR_g50552 [Chara braunii]